MSVPHLRLAIADDRSFSSALLPSDMMLGIHWTDTFRIDIEDYGTASWDTILRLQMRPNLFPSVARSVREELMQQQQQQTPLPSHGR
jgi:hypothetical protein